MLHGTSGTWETFCANIPVLSQHFNCYAIDMIGSGFTGKPDVDYEIPVYVAHLDDFMRTVGLTHASFIGVSRGKAVDDPSWDNIAPIFVGLMLRPSSSRRPTTRTCSIRPR